MTLWLFNLCWSSDPGLATTWQCKIYYLFFFIILVKLYFNYMYRGMHSYSDILVEAREVHFDFRVNIQSYFTAQIFIYLSATCQILLLWLSNCSFFFFLFLLIDRISFFHKNQATNHFFPAKIIMIKFDLLLSHN